MKDDGTIYTNQLQPYHQINMEVDKSKIKNPLLIPELENFSIVTDPNQYKSIDIPFYTSGVISGKVILRKGSSENPLSGIRVFLENEEEGFSKQLRTFSDGSFYAYEIPPGTYDLYIDEKQLNFLDAVSQPDTIRITVEALAEGDFIEDLNFAVIPKEAQ